MSIQSLETEQNQEEHMPAARDVFLYFLLLGFINIGGPVAQITMMYNKMVERSHWLSQDRFVKIMGFAHMLPGPEALQLAIYVGYLKKRIPGAILAGLTLIIAAGVIKLGRAAIKNIRLAAILIGAIIALYFFRIDFLIVLLIAGLVNLL